MATVSSAARRTHQGLPVWLKRSVVIALTGYADRSTRAHHLVRKDTVSWSHSGLMLTRGPTPLSRSTTAATGRSDHGRHDQPRSSCAAGCWAARFGAERRWAVEDCRHLSRRLERDLLAAGESIMRVPPKLMAHVRDSARTYGKSDPIDALAGPRRAT